MVKLARAARRHRSQDGTSIVEMVFVLPILLFLVFAIGDFGIAYTRWNSLTNAVREGARAGVVFRAPCDANTVRGQVQATVANFAAGAGVTGVTTTVTNPCGGTGTQLTVTAVAPYNYVALSAFTGLAPTTNLNARTVMRNE